MAEPTPRYDVMILSERAGYRAPGNALRTMVNMLAFRGFAQPYEEAVAKDWLEIYMKPGPAAHEVFHKYAYDGEQPVFHEAVLRADERGFLPEYGPTEITQFFMIEYRACVYTDPLGPFRKLLLDSLHLRVAVYQRPHLALPPHATVAEDERPEEKKKRERSAGLAGTEVDEW
ncbi:MAG: hypothetical protein RBU37_19230 [Myxococcota bacterium]|jgi:hypothetical protein|nr:hypothetical protein [Myxococcota bacterium]